MSGGTLIALAADEIVMDLNAVLGPVDPPIAQAPAASILAVLEAKRPVDIEDQTLIQADVSRKAIVQLQEMVPAEVYEFMSPFAQPTRTRPSVEYVPARYRSPSGRPSDS